MTNRWIARWGSVGLILVCAMTAHASEAGFDPSTYNPAAGEIVNFEVCEPCLGGGAFRYSWDFNGDGYPELQTDQSLVSHAFAVDGFHEVGLTVTDTGGRTRVARQGIIVGSTPALAIRDLLVEPDGAIFVLIEITVNDYASGIGIEEGIPTGWAVEIVDAGGAVTKANSVDRRYEVAWMSIFEAGDTVTFSYRLRPAYTSVLPTLQGTVSGYFQSVKGRFVSGIGGALALPR
jgi:PKD repeat protein